jgi:hypothetical protein
MVPSDSNNTERTKRTRTASTKVRDPANDAEPELPSHREAWTQARRQNAAAAPVLPSSTLTTSAPSLKRHGPSVAAVAGNGDDSIEVVEVVEGSSSAPAEGMDHIFPSFILSDLRLV